MQFSEVCHFVKMRPTIKAFENAVVLTNGRTGSSMCIDVDEKQLQWHCCLICGNYMHSRCPTNAMCTDEKHILFNKCEALKGEIEICIRLIDTYDKNEYVELSKNYKKRLVLLTAELENPNMSSKEKGQLIRFLDL